MAETCLHFSVEALKFVLNLRHGDPHVEDTDVVGNGVNIKGRESTTAVRYLLYNDNVVGSRFFLQIAVPWSFLGGSFSVSVNDEEAREEDPVHFTSVVTLH